MTRLRWSKESDGGRERLVLDGVIDESVRFDDLLPQLGEGTVIDLANVARINSSGVREWMRFLSRVNQGSGLVLARCSVPFVSQLNTIAGFAGRAMVESIMAPYQCAACGASSVERFAVTGDLTERLGATVPCKECGATMELDEVPEHYGAFAKA